MTCFFESEQRFAIKLCRKLSESPTETFDVIKQTYPEVSLARSDVFWWHLAFLECWEKIADEDYAGRPLTSTNTNNLTCVHKVLNSDHQLFYLIALMLNLSKSVVHDIVMVHLKVCPKKI